MLQSAAFISSDGSSRKSPFSCLPPRPRNPQTILDSLTSLGGDLGRRALSGLLADLAVWRSICIDVIGKNKGKTYRPVVWPAADLAADLAFSAFFALSEAARFFLPSSMACLRAAVRASGRCERRSLITSREAPTTARWALTCLRRRVLACSCHEHQYLTFVEALRGCAYLRDTLSPLATAENSPRNAAGVLALQEERLALAVLETEDLAIGADEELAL